MATDPWHFTRDDFASSVYSMLADGASNAVKLFGVPRTGKTEFLLKDLTPLAKAQGSRVVYANFRKSSAAPSHAPLTPLAVLLLALEKPPEEPPVESPEELPQESETGLLAMLRRALLALKLKLGLRPPDIVEPDEDITEIEDEPPDELQRLEHLLESAASQPAPTLLILDDVQEFADDPDAKPMLVALCAGLKERTAGLKTVLAGARREKLTSIFASPETAFLQRAAPIELPRLGEPFVDHILGAFEEAAEHPLPHDEMLAEFERLDANPHFFRMLLDGLPAGATLNVKAAIEVLNERVAADFDYPRIWRDLSPLQRGVAESLAMGHKSPFSLSFRQRVGTVLSERAPSATRVREALRHLEQLSLTDMSNGEWVLTAAPFAAWVKAKQR